MTGKRFKVDKEFVEYPKLVDTYTNCFYHIVDDIRNVEIFCERLNEQQSTINKQDMEIQSLNLHIEKLVDGDEISQLLMREYERSDDSEKENKELKQELREMDKLLKSYRETIKHDAELLADATRNGYLPPLDDFVKG